MSCAASTSAAAFHSPNRPARCRRSTVARMSSQSTPWPRSAPLGGGKLAVRLAQLPQHVRMHHREQPDHGAIPRADRLEPARHPFGRPERIAGQKHVRVHHAVGAVRLGLIEIGLIGRARAVAQKHHAPRLVRDRRAFVVEGQRDQKDAGRRLGHADEHGAAGESQHRFDAVAHPAAAEFRRQPVAVDETARGVLPLRALVNFDAHAFRVADAEISAAEVERPRRRSQKQQGQDQQRQAPQQRRSRGESPLNRVS